MKISRNRLLATVLMLTALLSAFGAYSMRPAESAYVDPAAHPDYAYLEGVLDTDTYWLYPYEKTSLDIGFSKYGEMINPDEPVGLHYGDVDAFCNTGVYTLDWSQGWLINMSWSYGGELHNVWAYALYSDFYAEGGDWVVNATRAYNPVATAPHGGRVTNGYAETDDIEVIYDGPRELVALLCTTFWDPTMPSFTTPPDPHGMKIAHLYIHVVFNKVKKTVLLIKDIKLAVETKRLKKVQVKFSERGEWDLGIQPNTWAPESYAHFYHDLPTKYFKNPWYSPDYGDTGFDLVQLISHEDNEDDPPDGLGQRHVAFAAYWPSLMSWRVADIAGAYFGDEDILTDLSDFEWTYTAPGGEDTFTISVPRYFTDEYCEDCPFCSMSSPGLWYPDCDFKPPEYDWGDYDWGVGGPTYEPGVMPHLYVNGEEKEYGVEYWIEDYDLGYPPSPGDPGMPGSMDLVFSDSPLEDDEILLTWKLHAHQDDMSTEPAVPYTIGEWVFDLSYYDTDLPTNQFRAITAYGLTDLNDGEDANEVGDTDNIIDKEVYFQLDEIFNPWDLRQATGSWSWAESYDWWEDYPGKWTERWVETFEGDGETTDFWLPEQIIVPEEYYRCWDDYCSFRERVLVDGELQIPYDVDEDDYDYTLISSPYMIEELLLEGPIDLNEGDAFDLTYPRIVPDSEYVWIEDSTTIDLYYDRDYIIDYTHGKLILLRDMDALEDDEVLKIAYDCYFPAGMIEFEEDSTPLEGAEITVFYSTFRIVWKVDKYIAWTDGVTIEIPDPDDWADYDDLPLGPWIEGYPWPGLFQVFFLRHRPVMPEYWKYMVHETLFEEWVEIYIDDEPYEGPWDIIEDFGILMIPEDAFAQFSNGSAIKVVYPLVSGRYEWTTVGTKSGAIDSAGASMVTEGFREWKNFDTKLASMDFQDALYGPEAPFLFRNVTGPGDEKEDYYDDQEAQSVDADAGRAHLNDEWCTALPISSSNIIVVGGGAVNLAAEYFNDFTDVYVPRIGEAWGTGLYSHACWAARGENLYEVEYDDDDNQITGYGVVSTYKDINGTTGFIVYGWTGQDTYYTCYALQHGFLDLLQWIQPGVTSAVLEFDYTMHPSEEGFFNVVECLGTFTECGGFDYFEFGMYDEETAEIILKIFKNSYSSEFLDFHVHIDLGYFNFAGKIVAIEIIRPNYIYIQWDAKVHDP